MTFSLCRRFAVLGLAAAGACMVPAPPGARAQPPPPLTQAQPAGGINADDPASVQREIVAAYKAGKKSVAIPPGVYLIPAPERGGCHLLLEDMHDFSIEAAGATLLISDQTKPAIVFRRCRNVTFRGATVRNATPPFTQGVVEAAAADRKSCDVRIDAGYPADLDDPKFFGQGSTYYLFDPATRLLKEGSEDTWATAERLGAGRFRLHTNSAFPTAILEGDPFAVRGAGGMAIESNECAGMVFEDVTVENAGVFGFLEVWGDGGNTYRRVRVQPGPKPPGATTEPLLSANADAFHSAQMRRGPTIEDAFFTRMPDDGIAIHGSFQTVREVHGNRIIVAQAEPRAYFAPGDHLEATSKEGVPMGEAVVTATKALADNYLPPMQSALRAVATNHCFGEITLGHALPVAAGDFTDNGDRLGSGYVLRRNTIKDHRARGMLLKARDGLVENNRVEGSSIAGIVLAPELWWGEAGYCRNVVVRGNTVVHVGYASVNSGTDQPGAISLVGELGNPDARGNRNITFENNTIMDTNGVNLEIDGVDGCTVRGNRFVRPQHQPTDRGAAKADPGALIFISRANGVHLEDNTVEDLGPANDDLVETTADAKEVTGAKEGVRVLPATH